jgi:nitroreductase
MDAIDALLGRNSASQLTDPAPRGKDLQTLFKAALRAPDHARLKPWRFLVIEGQGRAQLGEVFAQAALADKPALDRQALDKLRAKPLRAPLIIAVIARLQQHPKVPEIEQYLSAGTAAHGMLLAAHALGYAGIWRTGPMVFHPGVHRALGLQANEKLVGFLYLGTRQGEAKALPDYPSCDFFQYWG